MRVIAGKHRGTALADLGKGDMAAHLRPTTDRIRESLFNMLSGGRFGDPLTGARVLDLFAGTGALGLEALSRGADRVCFVENGRAGFKLITRNVAKLRAAEACTVLTKDATALAPNPYDAFDLVFLDPPYGQDLGAKALTNALSNGWIDRGALIVWEEDSPQHPPAGFDLLEHKTYGSTHVTLLRVN